MWKVRMCNVFVVEGKFPCPLFAFFVVLPQKVGPGKKFSTPYELAIVNLVVCIGTLLAVCNKF